jgi:hypothetical protein
VAAATRLTIMNSAASCRRRSGIRPATHAPR